jgi:hypothetical protein
MNDAKVQVDDRKQRFVVHPHNLGLDAQLNMTKLNSLVDQLEVEAVVEKINRDAPLSVTKSIR